MHLGVILIGIIGFHRKEIGALVNINLFVKPEKNSIFLKKGKTVILIENRKFSRSRMTKRTASLNSSREI